jgi:fucose 4-O-acetylase-like acetyltransferase
VSKTIPILRGLAILTVILSHANWNAIERFPAGDPGGYPLVVLLELGGFPVPAFLFISGYFIAYATSYGRTSLGWRTVWARIVSLLWPWLSWSAISVVGYSLQGRSITPSEIAWVLLVRYYFIVMLIVYYLLAPLIAKLIRRNVVLVVAGVAAIQVLVWGLWYAWAYYPGFPEVMRPWIVAGPLRYLQFALYLPSGIICATFAVKIRTVLAPVKPVLPWLALGLFAVVGLEALHNYGIGGYAWPTGTDQLRLTSTLLNVAFILCFVVFDSVPVPFKQTIRKLGTYSLGLYLCHYVIMGIVVSLIERFTPWVAGRWWLYAPSLFALTVAGCILLVTVLSRWPMKRLSRILLG